MWCKINKYWYQLLGILFFVFLFDGCTIHLGERSFGYSLTGASTNGAQTALVMYFVNHAPTVEPSLAQRLTQSIQNKVLQQTNLKLVSKDGDVTIEGSIDAFDLKTQSLSGGNNLIPTSNRLTVTIKVKFTNIKDHHFDYETSFTRYVDNDATKTLDYITSSNNPGYTTLIDQLTDDIFQKAFVNW